MLQRPAVNPYSSRNRPENRWLSPAPPSWRTVAGAIAGSTAIVFLLHLAALACSPELEDPAQDFHVTLLPALTLEDTVFETVGTVAGATPDYEDQNLRWARRHYPAWGNHVGGSGNLGPALLKAQVPRQAAALALNPIALTHHVWDNSLGQAPATFSTALTDSITASTGISWSKTVGVSESIGVEVGEGPAKVKSDTSLSVTVGQDKTESRTVEVGSSDDVSVTVPAGEIVVAVLLVQRGTLTAELALTWTLTGDTILYPPDGVRCADAPLLPRCVDYTRDGYRGTYGVLEAADLEPTSGLGQATAQVVVDFAGESVVRTASVPDADPATVDAAIAKLLREYAGD